MKALAASTGRVNSTKVSNSARALVLQPLYDLYAAAGMPCVPTIVSVRVHYSQALPRRPGGLILRWLLATASL